MIMIMTLITPKIILMKNTNNTYDKQHNNDPKTIRTDDNSINNYTRGRISLSLSFSLALFLSRSLSLSLSLSLSILIYIMHTSCCELYVRTHITILNNIDPNIHQRRITKYVYKNEGNECPSIRCVDDFAHGFIRRKHNSERPKHCCLLQAVPFTYSI